MDLTDDDLPLATFSWNGQSVADLDSWSARRRIVEPEPAPEPGSGGWGLLTADRRIADGQARFSQFQDQAEELVASQLAAQASAEKRFPLLPPVGFLPVDVGDLRSLTTRLEEIRDADDEADEDKKEEETEGKRRERRMLRETAERDLEVLLAAATAVRGPGFSLRTFFGELARFAGILDWEIAEMLLRDSWHRPPVVVAEPQLIPDNPQFRPRAGEVTNDDNGGRGGGTRPDLDRRINYYFVRENLLALIKLAGKPRSRTFRRDRIKADHSNLYVVFVANYLWLGLSRPPVLVDRILQPGPEAANPRPVPRPAARPAPSMTDLAVQTVRIHGSVPGPSPRAAAAALLQAIAPTGSDHSVLIVRRLRLDGFRGDQARGRLAELRRRAARPALAAERWGVGGAGSRGGLVSRRGRGAGLPDRGPDRRFRPRRAGTGAPGCRRARTEPAGWRRCGCATFAGCPRHSGCWSRVRRAPASGPRPP